MTGCKISYNKWVDEANNIATVAPNQVSLDPLHDVKKRVKGQKDKKHGKK